MGSDAARAGRREDAERLFEEVLAMSSEHPVALNALGVQALGDLAPGRAADFFVRAQAVDRDSPELSMNLAKAYRMLGDDAAEQAALEQALSIDQGHFMALVRLAELFERTGNMERAAERWRGVLALSPTIERHTPAIAAMLDHARETVDHVHARFAETVEARLANARAGLAQHERIRFDGSIDHLLGRRRIFHNECAGLHFPFLPAEEFFDRNHFPWMRQIEAATAGIQRELDGLLASPSPGFEPYIAMEPGSARNKWTPLDRKLDWGALHLFKNGVRDDEACARCPKTVAAVQALPLADIPGQGPNVFFSVLQPGTHLPAHTGVSNVRTIVHLPLIVPEGCSFRVGGETRNWRVGEAWAFDDTIEHEAWNRADKIRAILIFDVWNPYITAVERDLLRTFFLVTERNPSADRSKIAE